MKRNKARTLYSIFGILVTFILCYAIITTGYSYWDYGLQLNYQIVKAQLYLEEQNYSLEEIEKLKKLEDFSNVEQLTIFDESVWLTDPEFYENSVDETTTVPKVSVDQMKERHSYSVYIALKDTSNLKKSAKDIQKRFDLKCYVDSDVETYLNQGDSKEKNFYSACIAIIGFLFSIFSIMIIRNTMLISVVERMQDYGLFRCVGMSKKQLYMLLLTEGLLMSFVASVLGVACGYGLLQCLAPWINHTMGLEVYFTFGFYPKAILFTTLSMIAVTLYSLLEPARQAGLLSPIDSIHNNVVLRRKNGSLREKIQYRQGKIWGKIFGVSGEYAYKNMCRNRGRFVSLFIALFICVSFLVSIQSFLDSFSGSFTNAYQGKNQEFMEYISLDGKYDEQIATKIQKELKGLEDIKGTPLVGMLGDFTLYDPKLIQEKTEQQINFCSHSAYDEKHIRQFRRYLIEGEASYQEMVKENGVLLCDMAYNVSNQDTDFNQMDLRKTNYQVGDTISRLSASGKEKAKNAFEDAIAGVASKYNIPPTEEEARKLAVYSEKKEEAHEDGGMLWPTPLEEYTNEEKGFEKYREEVIKELKKKGFPILAYIKKDEITEMSLICDTLYQMEYDRGERQEYVIQGIISEDIFNGAMTTLYDDSILLIHAQDSVFEEERQNNNVTEWSWEIGVVRDVEKPDEEIKRFCEENSYSYGTVFDEGELYDYLDMMKTLKTIRLIAWIISACITIICFVQILNTLYANMALRKKELWLYSVVGMSPGQRMRMLLLEHTFAALLGIVFGYLAAWGISWYFVDYLLNQDGTIIYVWSWSKVLPIGIIVFILIMGISIFGINSKRKG